MADEPLVVDRRLVIPAHELDWRFGPSGGPGGQHANKASTRATLVFDLGASPSVPGHLRERMLESLGPRAPGGVITVIADNSRSQWRNRVAARRRLATLLKEAMKPARPEYRPRGPGRAAHRRRLEAKHRRSETKRLRKRPEAE